MPFGLFKANDASEHIFNAQGEQHLGMGFQFGQVDDKISPKRFPGQANRPKGFANINVWTRVGTGTYFMGAGALIALLAALLHSKVRIGK